MNRTSGLNKLDLVQVKESADKFKANVGKVIVGKRDAIELVLVALLCEGHILIEDVPGTGKTMLAKATAKSLGGICKRMQFTPDLLPSDVTGIHYFNQKTSEFEFRPGPIIANIVLVDEINRATPRTQSSLLESMQERQITVDLETIPLPRPFMVIATQNPVELEGTFPLPEAQIDRFLFRIELGYPSADEESAIILRFEKENPLDNLINVMDTDELLGLQSMCRQIHVEGSVHDYIIAITRATREHKGVELGASPRASLGLHMASQALAAVRGREYVMPDDVKHLAIPTLAHRLITRADTRLKGQSAIDIVRDILETLPVPVE